MPDLIILLNIKAEHLWTMNYLCISLDFSK